jgi:hypothetical protein
VAWSPFDFAEVELLRGRFTVGLASAAGFARPFFFVGRDIVAGAAATSLF